uniref:Beta-taxilin n=1 Tax=Knipowitschia caucasica TaxID=637954 RepID=A0AAV2K8F5_KNICA
MSCTQSYFGAQLSTGPSSILSLSHVSALLSSQRTMDASVKAAEVVLPPDVTERSLMEEEETAASFSPMDEFRRRLDEIVSSYSKGPSVLEQQTWMESDMDKRKEEEDHSVTIETEMSLIQQSLVPLSSPEEKLQELVKKYAEMASLRRSDEHKLHLLQRKFSQLLDDRQLLQKEQRNNLMARSKLEALCRELQRAYTVLREQTIESCREEEKKRNEMTSHFQEMLTEIQAQIEQHNVRNDKLCTENNSLTDKLEGLMNQCELREESLEKINKHRDLQQKLTEARLAQANALLVEAEDKHKREKEYLLREAIDKTKKCFGLKEQELSMKKKLALYAQKFDEFQATLAKSNEIFHRFKKEMDNMSEKMKTLEKESNLWKTRFENCNKALTDMLEERTEKSKEYDLFVLKIHKLEKLCRSLQDERKILYDKIRDVRNSNANISCKPMDLPPPESDNILTHEEIDELQSQDPVLTQDMARLKEEQAKLQLFADSLFENVDTVEEVAVLDLEEDKIASAFAQFKTKKDSEEEVKKEELEAPTARKDQEVEDTLKEIEKCPQEPTQMEKPKDDVEVEQAVILEKVESTPADHMTEANIKPINVEQANPELPEAEEVKVQVQEEKIVAEASRETMEKPLAETTSKPEPEISSESSKKQVPKKKKKRNNKAAS